MYIILIFVIFLENKIKMDQVLAQKLVEAASHVEQKLDEEIEKLDALNIDDIEKLREKRLKEMKKMQHQKQIWISQVCFLKFLYIIVLCVKMLRNLFTGSWRLFRIK